MGDWLDDTLKGIGSKVIEKTTPIVGAVEKADPKIGVLTPAPGKVTGTVEKITGVVADPAGAVASKVAEVATEGIEKALWSFAQGMVDGAQFLLTIIIDLLNHAASPKLDADFIYTMGGRLFFISLPLIVMFAAMRILIGSLRAQALVGVRDALAGAMGSVLGTIAMLPLTVMAVSMADGVADGLLHATVHDAKGIAEAIIKALVMVGTLAGQRGVVAGPLAPWQVPAEGVVAAAVVIVILGVLLVIATVGIGLVLVARNMLLYLVVVVGPICLSGLAWAPTRMWAAKWLSWMTALIFTRLGIVVAFSLGVLVIGTAPQLQSAGSALQYLMTLLSGFLMLILACFAPTLCFALFGFLGELGVRELHAAGMAAQGVVSSAASSALSAGQSAAGRAQSFLSESNNSGTVDASSSTQVGGDVNAANVSASGASTGGGAATAGATGTGAGAGAGAASGAAGAGAGAGAGTAGAGAAGIAVAAGAMVVEGAAKVGEAVVDGAKEQATAAGMTGGGGYDGAPESSASPESGASVASQGRHATAPSAADAAPPEPAPASYGYDVARPAPSDDPWVQPASPEPAPENDGGGQ